MNRINPTNNQPEIPNFSEGVLAAMADFKAAKPWRGTVEERKPKFEALHKALCESEGCNWSLNLDLVLDPEPAHGNGGLKDSTNEIVMIAKLSVVTYLFCFAAAAYGLGHDAAIAWAQALYKQVFPVSAARMTFAGGLVLNQAETN